MGWASAAWIDEVTGKVQILNEEFAKEDVNFDTAEAAQSRKGVLQATYTPIRSVEDPKYYSHFTLSKFKTAHSSCLIMTKERRIWGWNYLA